jgi:putative mRNA 3-end processing factor
LRGRIVLCPPGALNDRWSRGLPPPVTAKASGWMGIRQRARPRNGELRLATGVAKAVLRGRIVLCPPGALNDRWSRRLPDPITAMASGWMRIRQRARQRNVELPLVISDHSDWDELTQTIRDVAPKEVWITHGREDALMHWCMTHQIKARELNLVGYEDEDD